MKLIRWFLNCWLEFEQPQNGDASVQRVKTKRQCPIWDSLLIERRNLQVSRFKKYVSGEGDLSNSIATPGPSFWGFAKAEDYWMSSFTWILTLICVKFACQALGFPLQIDLILYVIKLLILLAYVNRQIFQYITIIDYLNFDEAQTQRKWSTFIIQNTDVCRTLEPVAHLILNLISINDVWHRC